MKQCVFVVLLFFAGVSLAPAQDSINLPCEVLEVSPNFQTDYTSLNKIHYLLIRHANAADRMSFSKWLKAHSGTEVVFIVNDTRYHGVLCRMPHCFGRGLLIFVSPVTVKPRDIIELELPSSSL